MLAPQQKSLLQKATATYCESLVRTVVEIATWWSFVELHSGPLALIPKQDGWALD